MDFDKRLVHSGDIIIIPSGEMHELIAPTSGKRLIYQVDHAIIREVNGFDSIYTKFFPCDLFQKSEKMEGHEQLMQLLLQISEE